MQGYKSRNRKDGSRRGKRSGGRILLLAAALLLVCGAGLLIVRYTPTNKTMSDEAYFGPAGQDETAIILGDRKIEERALVSEGGLYLPYQIVRDHLNGRFYWDADLARMLFTTAVQEYEIPVNSTSYSIIDGVLTTDRVSEGSYDRTILLRPDGRQTSGGDDSGLYLSADFLQAYTPVEYTWIKDEKGKTGGHVLIAYQWGEVLQVKAAKEAAVRYQGGIKSPILTSLEKGETATVLEEGDKWLQVLTKKGYIGYVKKSRMSPAETVTVTTDRKAQEYPSMTLDQPVVLVWHQISAEDGNSTLADMTGQMTGANVISPTWFSLTDDAGGVSSIGKKTYTKAAHQKDLQVWGLISDFSSDMDTSAVLASTSARRTVIGHLSDYAKDLDLDGINLDFEYMEEADALSYVQFVRELSIACRRQGLVLSVDIKPPYDFNFWMNRKELGTVADYLINMGYDQHYSGSEAGTVASLSYEQDAIEETLKQGVPAEKLVSAIPFYTRIWYTSGEDTADHTTSEILSMAGAQKTLQTWNQNPVFDPETFQHYADWTTGEGVRCRIWLEDADSIGAKVRLIPRYGLGGTAAWALGFETSDIWTAISDNIRLSQEEAGEAQQEAESRLNQG